MATVRFSKELTDRILGNAKQKMNAAVAKAMDTRPDQAWGQRIYDTMFADVKPALAQLPAGWVKTTDQLHITKVGTTPCSLGFTLSPAQPWPVKFQDTALARHDWSDRIALTDNPVWSEFYAEVVAYKQRVRAAEERQREFVAMVAQVIEAYTTLAPALKAWPALWDLIPEDVKDKHREIKERDKKEVKLEVDLSKLTALSTAAKFGI